MDQQFMQPDVAEALAPSDEAELAACIAQFSATARPLQIVGGATRHRPAEGTRLTTRAIAGIVDYEPGALTLIARAGTPLAEIEAALAAENQMLAFEPMDHRVVMQTQGEPTVGGMVAVNASGPRRLQAGACRDHVLGVRFVDGQGRILRNGGRVMKNVTGMDLGKLMTGSAGRLGVLTEVALKVLPRPERQATLRLGGLSPRQAVELFSTALATPFEISGAAMRDGAAFLRIEGLETQVIYRTDRLRALLPGHAFDLIEDAESRSVWRDLTDLRHMAGEGALWRILTKPTDSPAIIEALKPMGGAVSLDWGGGLVWYRGPAKPAEVLAAVGDGSASRLYPGPVPPKVSDPAGIEAALRRTFDPAGILNAKHEA